jgi:hypothetical protein
VSTKQRTLCVDFDGVISDYSKGYQGIGVFGAPISGADTALHKLRLEGWKIIIFTTRGEISELARYLHVHNIPFDEINKNSSNPPGSNIGKPIADAYLDDRAIRFTGDWTKAYQEVTTLKPWQ